jgi:tetratricopeptide (TPR) repeat protein
MMGFPARAEPYANRLPTLAPGASHLIHMPSHTFYWVGRYQDAADANVKAAALGQKDVEYAKLQGENSLWRLDYHAHNVQFGVGGALISGDGKDALALAGPMLTAMLHDFVQSGYGMMAAGTAYAAKGRFDDTAAVLALPDPGAKAPPIQAFWHYARGEALARQGNAAGVRAEAEAIGRVSLPAKADKPVRAAYKMAAIARLVLAGRAAMLDHRPDHAIGFYARAAKIEESKVVVYYADPPAWWYPVRRSLAAALLEAGRPADALVQANAAIKLRPMDPVTFALRARINTKLGNTDEAARDQIVAKRQWRGDASAFEPALP